MKTNTALVADAAVTKLPNARVEVRGSIAPERLAPFRSRALREMLAKAELPGFRKGKVPEKMFLERVGEMHVLEEAAERAIAAAYLEVVEREKLSPIGRPAVTIRALAPGNPLEFTIESALAPSATLPDYRTLAKAIMSEEDPAPDVSDADVDEFVWRLAKKKVAELTPEDLAKFGAESSEKLAADIRSHLGTEKERAAREKKRLRAAEAIIDGSAIELPDILVESELDRMTGQFEADLSRFNSSLNDYLEKTKKTRDSLRTEWRKDAEKRAKMQVVVTEIAVQESIVPPKDIVDAEVKRIVGSHAGVDEERARVYVESVVTNEEVFRFLENTAAKKTEK